MNMSERDYDGRTALHVAAAEGQLECVEFLLRHCRVSPSIQDRWGNTPLEDAVRFQHERVAELIRSFQEGGAEAAEVVEGEGKGAGTVGGVEAGAGPEAGTAGEPAGHSPK